MNDWCGWYITFPFGLASICVFALVMGVSELWSDLVPRLSIWNPSQFVESIECTSFAIWVYPPYPLCLDALKCQSKKEISATWDAYVCTDSLRATCIIAWCIWTPTWSALIQCLNHGLRCSLYLLLRLRSLMGVSKPNSSWLHETPDL